MTQEVEIFANPQAKGVALPIFTSEVAAGFPSVADGFLDKKLDLNELLITHPAATFFVRVNGDSMKDAGIFSKDLLIVDRSLTARSGNIVVALYEGEFTVKKLIKDKGRVYLVPANPAYPTLQIKKESDFQVWGIVTHVIHTLV